MKKNIPTFFVNGVEHRIVFRTRLERHPGYVDPFETHENVVQKRTGKIFKRWIDVEKEEVPGFVVIERGVFGFSQWKSELIKKWRLQHTEAFPY